MEEAQSCAGFITILANAYCYFCRSGRVITHGTQVCNCCCHCTYFINAVFQFAYAIFEVVNASVNTFNFAAANFRFVVYSTNNIVLSVIVRIACNFRIKYAYIAQIASYFINFSVYTRKTCFTFVKNIIAVSINKYIIAATNISTINNSTAALSTNCDFISFNTVIFSNMCITNIYFRSINFSAYFKVAANSQIFINLSTAVNIEVTIYRMVTISSNLSALTGRSTILTNS